MIWTFGLIAALILLIAVNKIPGRNEVNSLTPRMAKAQEAATEELRTISSQLTDMQQRLDSMERILEEVE